MCDFRLNVYMKWVRKVMVWGGSVAVAIVILANSVVLREWLPYIRSSQETHALTYPVGIVLGASVRRDGTLSASLQQRVDAAVLAMQNGVVTQLLISGDGVEDDSYKETPAIYKTLLDKGIPSTAIIVDPAGVDTYDSMRRAKELYNLDRVLIFSQGYHLPRSIYIARSLGIDAWWRAVDGHDTPDKTYFPIRESIARVKAAMEVEFRHPWAKYGTRLISH